MIVIVGETPNNSTSVPTIVCKENEAQNNRHVEHIKKMMKKLKKEGRKNLQAE